MSDEKLRELERRWKETGSVEDEAKYLLERVRVGDLEQEKLELAAYCGHEGARIAVHYPPAQGDLGEWVQAYHARFGRHAVVRLALEVLALWAEQGDHSQLTDTESEALPRLIAGAREWVGCPCDSHADRLERLTPFGRRRTPVRIFSGIAFYCRSTPRFSEATPQKLRDLLGELVVACDTADDDSPAPLSKAQAALARMALA